MLVSHNPPKDTACDVIPGDVHVGSTAVREFLEEAQPDICLCGHIHEARAVDRVGRTVVVNPGALAQGGYVLLRSNSGRLSAERECWKTADTSRPAPSSPPCSERGWKLKALGGHSCIFSQKDVL